jgi:2-methylcitrate dehydratase
MLRRVVITTHESAMRIIDKTGPLHNPADRDHCLQYMTAIGLLFGKLTADHYEDKVASDPRIDALRAKMRVVEDKQFSADYLDPGRRSIANAVQVFFRDGSSSDRVVIEYPLGHRKRRKEGIPELIKKFERSLRAHYSTERAERILSLCNDAGRFAATSAGEFMGLLVG